MMSEVRGVKKFLAERGTCFVVKKEAMQAVFDQRPTEEADDQEKEVSPPGNVLVVSEGDKADNNCCVEIYGSKLLPTRESHAYLLNCEEESR